MSFKVYHNHIPRTGGVSILNHLTMADAFSYFKHYWRDDAYFDIAHENKIYEADFVSGHFGIGPNIIYPEIKTVTTIRNPINRIVSHFIAIKRFYEKENIFPENVKNDIVKLFDYWVNSEYDMLTKSNFQARYLTNSLSENYFNKNGRVEIPPNYDYENEKPILVLLKDAWGIDDKEPTYEMAMDYLSRCILVGKTENIADFIDSLFNILNNNFNINLINPKINKKMNGYKQSEILIEKISQQNIDILIKLNEIDMNLWESIP